MYGAVFTRFSLRSKISEQMIIDERRKQENPLGKEFYLLNQNCFNLCLFLDVEQKGLLEWMKKLKIVVLFWIIRILQAKLQANLLSKLQILYSGVLISLSVLALIICEF